jgi:Transglycosylase SLT domain
MQKRLLSMLVIGGVAVLCFAPKVVRAEDRTPLQWEGSSVSNIDVAVPALQTPSPSSPEIQNSVPVSAAGSPMPERYRSLIDAISRNNGVDPDLIDAMVKTESNYNPWAISSKGARGLMQLIPETGHRFGVLNFFDPQQNIEGGVRYIKYLLDMFGGNVDLSLAAYNAGENLVARLGKIPPYPETRNYVRKIRAAYTKPSMARTASILSREVNTQPAPAVSTRSDTLVSSTSSEKSSEKVDASIIPISKWTDERGIRHFSNIEPLK